MNRIIEKIDGNGKSFYYPQWKFLKIFWVNYIDHDRVSIIFGSFRNCQTWLNSKKIVETLIHEIE